MKYLELRRIAIEDRKVDGDGCLILFGIFLRLFDDVLVIGLLGFCHDLEVFVAGITLYPVIDARTRGYVPLFAGRVSHREFLEVFTVDEWSSQKTEANFVSLSFEGNKL